MDSVKARVSISLSEGRFEFEGDEAFVASQLVKFEDSIKKAISSFNFVPSAPSNEPKEQKRGGGEPEGVASLSKYENLFALADGKIQILKTLPGGSTAEKMLSAALLLAFGNSLNGQESTSFEAVRALCKAHGCLDASNFSKVMKAQKGIFVVTGGSRSNALSLTVPGKKKAETVANGLNLP